MRDCQGRESRFSPKAASRNVVPAPRHTWEAIPAECSAGMASTVVTRRIMRTILKYE
jgi:hypothetical protein